MFIMIAASMCYLSFWIGGFIVEEQSILNMILEMCVGLLITVPFWWYLKSSAICLIVAIFSCTVGFELGYVVHEVVVALFNFGSTTTLIISMVIVAIICIYVGHKYMKEITIVTFSFTSMFLIMHGFAYCCGKFPTFQEMYNNLNNEDIKPITDVWFWVHIFLFAMGFTGLAVY